MTDLVADSMEFSMWWSWVLYSGERAHQSNVIIQNSLWLFFGYDSDMYMGC